MIKHLIYLYFYPKFLWSDIRIGWIHYKTARLKTKLIFLKELNNIK